MTYWNISDAWEAGGVVNPFSPTSVTPQYYAERALANDLPMPTVIETRAGLIIDGAIVAVPQE